MFGNFFEFGHFKMSIFIYFKKDFFEKMSFLIFRALWCKNELF